MKVKGSIEEQLELFDSDTMKKLKPEHEDRGEERGETSIPQAPFKVTKTELCKANVDPEHPYEHFVFKDLAPNNISRGNILLHWAGIHKKISIRSAAELVVKDLSGFLELLHQSPAPDEEELHHKLALAIGDFTALLSCLETLVAREKMDEAMFDILTGKKPTLD